MGTATTAVSTSPEFSPCILGVNGATKAIFDAAVTNGDIKIVKTADEAADTRPSTTDTTASNCVAKFFLYEARDIKRWVYGVERSYGSGSITAPGSQVYYLKFQHKKNMKKSSGY